MVLSVEEIFFTELRATRLSSRMSEREYYPPTTRLLLDANITFRILQPDGVVEFLEIDPRPRAMAVRCGAQACEDHKSSPETNWTDNITDRFKDPFGEQIVTTVPGWTARVAERLKANLRPRDGVPAANLKSWLEGAG